MKREIVEYVSKCGICQQVKVEHQRPAGPLQPLQIPEWKWEMITMDFMLRFPKWSKRNDMGHRRSVDEIRTILAYKDDQLGGQACQDLYKRGGTTPWDSDVHCITSRSQVHLSTLVEHTTCLRDKIGHEHCVSPSNGWPIKKSYPSLRRPIYIYN